MDTVAEKLMVYRRVADRSSTHPGVVSMLKLADDLANVPPNIVFRAIMEDWSAIELARAVYAHLRTQS